MIPSPHVLSNNSSKIASIRSKFEPFEQSNLTFYHFVQVKLIVGSNSRCIEHFTFIYLGGNGHHTKRSLEELICFKFLSFPVLVHHEHGCSCCLMRKFKFDALTQ